MSPFEIIMLGCFGISWPISIYKSWKTGQSAGKSVVFMSVILVGYVAGVLHKIIYAPDFVVYLYVFNFIMVSIDLGLTVRNRRREPQNAIVRDLD